MPKSKCKPAARRAKRALIDAEKKSIARWREIADKHPEGSLIYRKAMQNINVSELKLRHLDEWSTP